MQSCVLFWRTPGIKCFISTIVQEIIQTNENGEFTGHMQIKVPWILEAPSYMLVAELITIGRNFSQLFEVEPKHCVIKMGIICQDLTNHIISQNRDTGF